jgi:hypothetical protein
MTIEQMIETYTELIRKQKHSDKMLESIFLKHKMQNTLDLVNSLGNYYDHLTGLNSDDTEWQRLHNEQYDISEETQSRMDSEWSALENDLRIAGEIK